MTCTHCTAKITNGVALCERCQQTLVQALVNVAAYFADVDHIQPGSRVKVRSAYQSTPPPGVEPPRDAIADALDHVATIVFGWCRNLEDDRPGVPGFPASTERRCGWLESHVPSITTLEWAGECVREMLDCERQLRRILDRADTGWYAGRCGNEVGRETTEDGEVIALHCQRGLYVTKSSNWVRCPECGRTWNAEDRRKIMRDEAGEELAPVRVIARIVVGLIDSESSVERLTRRIEQWVHRKQLEDYGVRVLDGHPRRVYRVADVLKLVSPKKPQDDAEAC